MLSWLTFSESTAVSSKSNAPPIPREARSTTISIKAFVLSLTAAGTGIYNTSIPDLLTEKLKLSSQVLTNTAAQSTG